MALVSAPEVKDEAFVPLGRRPDVSAKRGSLNTLRPLLAPIVTVACPTCGQALTIPTTDLAATFACPRCATPHKAAVLVPPETPIPAIAVRVDPGLDASSTSPNTPPPPIGALPSLPLVEPSPTPKPAAPAPRGPGVVGQLGAAARMALEAGQLGARGVGGFGERVLDAADRFDRACYGRRASVLWALALLTVLGTAMDADQSPRAPLWMALTTTAFCMVALPLGLGRALSFREDNGSWSLHLVAERLANVVALAIDALSTTGRTRAIGKVVVFLGAVTLVVRNILVLASIVANDIFATRLATLESMDDRLLWASMGVGGVGILLWLLGSWRLHNDARRLHLRPKGREVEDLLRAAKAMPAVVDCREERNVAAVRACGNPLLTQLVDALAKWKPRKAIYEKDYQASLHRHLCRVMPEAEPERERPFKDARGRLDIVVGGAILIEMKVNVSTSTADKGLGQVLRYGQYWHNGPLVLLLCGAGKEEAERSLIARLDAVRAAAPVTVVLAGRSTRWG